MIYQSPDNLYSHYTAIQRKQISFPTRFLLEKEQIRGRVLDFGCGRMVDLLALRNMGMEVVGFDPHYLNEWPKGQFDTIICHYVLNVLLPIEQTYVLMCVAELLKPGGKAFFTVRRDLKVEGFRTHHIHRVPTYQCNVKLPFKSIKKANHCEIYEYRSYPLTQQKAVEPFLGGYPAELVTETASVYAIYSQQSIQPGHVLVIPKRKVDSYFSLSLKEQTACTIVVRRVHQILQHELKPDGFNLIVNDGLQQPSEVPVQPHLHVIPRFY